jgi:hypothetical protein
VGTQGASTSCNVTITASIAIYAEPGSGITHDELSAAAATMRSSIQDAWTGSFQQDGVAYNVSTKVTVSVASSAEAATSSGAQNVLKMTTGPIELPDGRTVGAQVDPKSLIRWIKGGPDLGWMDIHNVAGYSEHEFSHMLGTFDKPGAVISNTLPGMRPTHATQQDFRWGIQEAVGLVNMGVSMMKNYRGPYQLPSTGSWNPGTVTVGAPLLWWK